jgi:hypothetical protein
MMRKYIIIMLVLCLIVAVINAIVLLKRDNTPSPPIKAELIDMVGEEVIFLGPCNQDDCPIEIITESCDFTITLHCHYYGEGADVDCDTGDDFKNRMDAAIEQWCYAEEDHDGE